MALRWHTRLASVLVVLALVAAAAPPATGETPATDQPAAAGLLVRVDLAGPVDRLGVPIFAHLKDARGREWALVIAPAAELESRGLAYSTIDRDATPGAYLLALERRPGARDEAARRMDVLLDDGRVIVVRIAAGRADELAGLGFDVQALPDAPLVLTRPELPVEPAISYDARVAAMISQVQQADLWADEGGLSGENAVTVGGSPYTITTRKTASGTPIEKATQYVYERMLALGLQVSYHSWSAGGYSNRNVIGAKAGKTKPTEIVLITAHLDDTSSTSVAPGADDNGSGSVGLLDAATIMSQYYFDRTVRFVFFTGEEQGLYGSQQYASAVYAAGDNIVGVYNMDMIAWDRLDGPTLRLHTRTASNPGYPADSAIANLFSSVVTTYGLTAGLTPIIDADGITASDHASFWSKGYPAILAIEDDVDDFNAYYHQPTDKRQELNMGYFTSFVKASVGTSAHLALPADAPCQINATSKALAIDAHPGTGVASDLDGMLEPGEAVMVTPSWKYPAGCSPALITGTASGFNGPDGFAFTLLDPAGSYGIMAPQETANCFDKTANCYVVRVSNPTTRPALHVDARLDETLTYGAKKAWTLHVGNSFADAGPEEWAYSYIETILHRGVTTGCDAEHRLYCPALSVKRDQMAVFLARALAGSDANVPPAGSVPGQGDYNCAPTAGVSLFADVQPTDWFCRHAHRILSAGITTGCDVDLHLYCPTLPVSRGAMAVFIARAVAGSDAAVPLAYTDPSGRSYDCNAATESTYFTDVPAANWTCRYVHYLWAKGTIDGCDPDGHLYCPAPEVLRDAMAKFLTTGFGLTLYAP